MKVAIIHYWFITRRGGEKVVENILKLFPDADVYTLFYDKEQYGQYLKGHKVYTSALNVPFLRKRYQKIFPLYPYGIKSLRLKKDYDLIISSESGPAKGVNIPKSTPHICYIHSPMRYCWGFTNEYLQTVSKPIRPILKFLFERLRKWDEKTIDNVNFYIANSRNVAGRVQKYYKRSAKVVYPPISNEFFKKNTFSEIRKDVFLSFGAITPYKRIDLLVDAFNESGELLIIIGEGSERAALEKKANKNIIFKGSLSWNQIENIFARTRALIFPGEEDFGMIPLEVMAYGIPVLALKKGGALETVVENEQEYDKSTGLFFEEQTVACLNECIERFVKNEHLFNRSLIKKHSEQFKEDFFIKNFSNQIKELLERYENN